MASQKEVTVVDVKQFLEATRDAGYRNFESAIAELVDNSLQAGATAIEIALSRGRTEGDGAFRVEVCDDGRGMNQSDLVTALQFGGSKRFNDRSGLGRFGMGLPNSSLSQARRVDVVTWHSNGRRVKGWQAHLDLDELLAAPVPLVPPARTLSAAEVRQLSTPSGTRVIWRHLDRVKPGTWGQLPKRLHARLGQKFRHFLWDGCHIRCNGEEVRPFDPLFLSHDTCTPQVRAKPYGKAMHFQFDAGGAEPALVEVRFSELPVAGLTPLPNRDKRTLGIVGGAGVSIIRAGREIDYGWFFFDKRRENYDDWWRCEISFPPHLDELFGVTHTKQGIRPADELKAILSKELSGIARTLNRRAQDAHMAHAQEQAQQSAANMAGQRDILLRPLPSVSALPLKATDEEVAPLPLEWNHDRQKYRFRVGRVDDGRFCRAELHEKELVVILNQHHEFYDRIYRVLEGRDPKMSYLRRQLELLLLALGRAHCNALGSGVNEEEVHVLSRFMDDWSRAVAVFCGTLLWREMEA